MIDDDELPHVVMGACMEVHRELGAGWDDFAYRIALAKELKLKELFFARNVPISILYKGERIESAARADFLVEERLVLLVHAVDQLEPFHKQQLASYLRHGGYRSGFVINFNVVDLRDGVKRIVLRPAEEE
jgi:GxxExxY protein